MAMARILICDPLQQAAKDIMGDLHEVVDKAGIGREELLQIVEQFDAIVVRARTQVDSEVISRGGRLRVIARAGVGTDNIDVGAATDRGILVVNSPDPSITSVAELAYALLLGVCRRVANAHMALLEGKSRKHELVGTELAGKTLGIVGLGRIGSKVATIAKSFGLNVMATDPYASAAYAEKLGAELVELKRLLEASDFVTLHVPLTDQTRGLIGREEMALMKPGSVLVNTSRSEVVDQDSLVENLERKSLSAGLDVFDDRYLERLAGLGNVLLTPHIGASTIEAQSQIAELIAQEVVDALEDRPARNPVNLPYIDRKSLEFLQPYLQLTEKMVKMLHCFHPGRPNLVSLSLHGEASEVENVDFLIRTSLMWMLSPFHEVNVVNAMSAAERMGIRTELSRSSHRGSYLSSLELRVQSEEELFTVRGALVDSDKPRIVGLQGYELEFTPEGSILITEHEDIPGMVGTVGTLLGAAGINIGTMHLARKKAGEKAMMIMLTDKDVPTAIVEKLRSMKGMSRTETLRL